MTDSRVALGMDRLPWLPDEPVRTPKRSGNLLGWALAAVLGVAGASYWLGTTVGNRILGTVEGPPARPVATAPLPRPLEQRETPRVSAPDVEPIVAPPLPIVEAPPIRRAPVEPVRARPEPAVEAESTAPSTAESEPPAEVAPVAPAPVYSGPWPVRVVEGASGRLVRIGAFRTARQAKKGWWAIVRMNPTLKRLPALVVPVQSLRNGRVYYRLQMGTTSQAHSTVLCQRMRMIAQSCVVIDDRGKEVAT